ncbi:MULTISPECIES: hypothetical protein [unclassified Sphingobium]|uniref:hypothetical protein n=1 Tax=unclassified Sphingobium TaxID=2611147 RepID=UPI0012EDF785|nr:MULTISPECIES: hypothetical protein [unclassified Sphingobium]UZW57879.1 hypothetical protein NUH86_23015 [Sphingobium sp. JS3065]
MMLVSIYLGQDIPSAKLHGALYFSQLPQPGEKVMLGCKQMTVSKAWHTPDTLFAGPKYAVLADGYHINSATEPRRDDQEAAKQFAGHRSN